MNPPAPWTHINNTTSYLSMDSLNLKPLKLNSSTGLQVFGYLTWLARSHKLSWTMDNINSTVVIQTVN